MSTAAAEIRLSPTLSLLADLIGSFAFPNPDDDSEPHGPGAPHIRPGALAEIRRVTISVLAWAERLGEQGAIDHAINEGMTMQQIESTPDSASATSQKEKSKPDTDSATSDDGCGAHTDGTHGKQPPTVAMEMIEPAVKRFVQAFPGDGPVFLPVPSGSGVNPWKLSFGSERLRTLGLLLAGAQFQFAAEATRLGKLRALFQWAARELIDQGARRLGHDSKSLLRDAV